MHICISNSGTFKTPAPYTRVPAFASVCEFVFRVYHFHQNEHKIKIIQKILVRLKDFVSNKKGKKTDWSLPSFYNNKNENIAYKFYISRQI